MAKKADAFEQTKQAQYQAFTKIVTISTFACLLATAIVIAIIT